MPRNSQNSGNDADDKKVIRVEGQVQGLVIGDHNTVIQHFNVKQDEFPMPRESPRLASYVFGRNELVKEIRKELQAGSGNHVTVLCGMGGMGKSTLASHVSTLPDTEALFSDGCFWVDLQNGDIMEALSRMAQAFGQNVDSFENVGSRSRAIRSILQDKRVLIVLDNAWDEPSVTPFLSQGPDVAVLVTTRDEGLAYMLTDRVIKVDRLKTKDAVHMLVQMIGKTDGESEDKELISLVENLGCLPLALELVGKQARKEVRRPGFSWARLKGGLEEGEKRLGLGRGENTVRNAFEQTWQRALDASGHRHFSFLGIFPHNDMLTGEIASAWGSDEGALEGLSELIDLSVLHQIDEVTVRLHPLLKDFAAEKLRDIDQAQQIAAHQRVFEFHFERAPEKPIKTRDIQPVLAAHHHAWKAADRERAKRVFPWFTKSDSATATSTAVPGFLIDHGYRITLVHHYEMELDLAKNGNVTAHAWAEYRLGDALASIGDLESALTHLKEALAMSENSDLSEDAKIMDRAKFSYRAGQVSVEVGDYHGAISAYNTALEMDRKMGQTGNELITMLQIADLHLMRNELDDYDTAIETIRATRELARSEHRPEEEVMALTRLADLTAQYDSATCVQHIKEALALDNSEKKNLLDSNTSFPTSAFSGRQGAKYASALGKIAAGLAFNGDLSMVQATLTAYSLAIKYAGDANSWYEQSMALYWLGNFFENLFLVDGYEAERSAAWACYSIAEKTIQGMELQPGINPRERIETRILPQMDNEEKQRLATSIQSEPLAIVKETVDRLVDIPLWDSEIKTLV